MKHFERPTPAILLSLLTLLLSLFLAPALRAQILYEEDWEDAELGFPVGWSLGNVDDGNVDPGQACSGQALRMNLHSGNTNSTVSSPLINRGGTPGKLIISFDYRVADWNDNSQLSGTGLVGMNINGSGVWGQSISLTTGCERQTLTRTLAQVPLNSDFQITFVSTWTTGDWAYVADNITVRVIPDNCFDAYPLTQSTSPSADLSNPTDGSLEGATQTFTGCSGTANDDVWYSFTATTRAIDITVEAESDVVVVLYEGLCSGLNRLVCRDALFINESFRYDGIDPGETYLVRVHSFGSTPLTGSDAEFRIEVGTPDPVNDECVSAERISQSASDVCTSPTSATLENGSNSRPDCTGNTTANDDVWFEFDATTDHFEVFVEAGDVVVELLTGTCDNLTSLACEDSFFDNESIDFDGATPGNTYYVRVYSFGNTPLTGAAAEFDICVYTVCPDPPTGLAVNSITATTAFVAGNYDIGLSRTHLVVAAGGSPTGAAVYQELSVLGSTTATGLSPNTAYDYYTIPDCGSNTPVGPVTFTTLVAGDECVDAFTLTQSAATSCGTNLTMGTVENATESQAGCTGTANDDVWYAFTATSTDFSVFLESGDFVVELFEGSCGSPSSLVCRDLFSVNETFNYADATIGQTYYLRVHSFNATPLTGTDAEFGICVFTTPPAPANDECADAVLLPVNPTVTCSAAVSGTTNGASRTEGDALCGGSTGLASVWYRFTASETEHFITLSNVDILNGSDGDRASFEVFSGGCGARTRVQCSGQLIGTPRAGTVFPWTWPTSRLASTGCGPPTVRAGR